VILPALWRGLGPDRFWMLMAGGAVYTVGALIVGSQRPDPRPEVFGYHEIWHAMVVVAATIHYILLAELIRG
jgi:hemolysin III